MTQNTLNEQPVSVEDPKYKLGQTAQDTQNQNSPHTTPKIDPNVLAALSYVVPVFLSLVILYTEKQNKFVRFHALQALMFYISWIALASMALNLRVILIGVFLLPIINIAGLGTAFFLAWKAYNNQEYELPIIGKLARDQIYKQ